MQARYATFDVTGALGGGGADVDGPRSPRGTTATDFLEGVVPLARTTGFRRDGVLGAGRGLQRRGEAGQEAGAQR